jgi:hypothetical protein
MPRREPIALTPAQRRFVAAHRAAVAPLRRGIFDRAVRSALRGEIAPAALAAAVSRALHVASAAPPAAPVFRKDIP